MGRMIIYLRQNIYNQQMFGLLCRRVVFQVGKKSRRVIQMSPTVLTVDGEQQVSDEPKKCVFPSQEELRAAMDDIPVNWQDMPFHELCNLSPITLNALELQVKKYKFTAEDEAFSIPELASPDNLSPYWKNVHETLTNQTSIEAGKVKEMEEKGYLKEMYVYDVGAQEMIKKTIVDFVNHIGKPAKLEAIAQPSFCKYLLGLKRDLSLRGVNIESENVFTEDSIKILKVLNYEYEFWVDVKHNRNKNGTEEDFIIAEKDIPNPNDTLLLKDSPEIRVRYIARKKKRKQIEMCFCTKIDLLIQIQNKTHIIKLEWKGPTTNKHILDSSPSYRQYLVIDFDELFNGNPTIKPTFRF